LPVDKYKAFYEIVKMLMKMDLTKLRSIQKELSVLSKVTKSVRRKTKNGTRNMNKTKRKASKKRPSPAQVKARKEFAMRVRRGDFR
jgi:hypothetical protein